MTTIDSWSSFDAIGCEHIAKHGRENQDEIDRRMVAEIADILSKTLRPRPKMDVDECADKYRIMPGGTTRDIGRFRTSTYEIGRGPMMALTEPGVRIVTACAAVQLFKTTLIENMTLHSIIVDPAPIIILQPSKRAAKVFSLSKLKPMLYASKEARALLTKYTQDRVYFVGGDITIVGAGSETDVSMVPRKRCASDEINKIPLIKGGDVISMAEDRLESWDEEATALRVCSPEFPDSPIAKSVEEGDIRKAFVPCPHCGHEQVLEWALDMGKATERRLVRWDEDITGRWNPRTIRYHCVECDKPWTNSERLRAIAQVKWKQTRPFTCCADKPELGGGYQEPEKTRSWEDVYRARDGRYRVGYATCVVCKQQRVPNEHASFDEAGRLYSPKSLTKLVRKFKAALGSPSKMKIFVNQQLCRVWRDETEVEMSAEGLMARCEVYPQEVPDRVAILTCGVDVQDDRIEYEVVGWGRQLESWSIAYGVILGKPEDATTWAKLDDVLMRGQDGRDDAWQGKDGRKFVIQATAIDTGGHNTMHVYRYCRARDVKRVFAIRGKPEVGRNVAPIWPRSPTMQSQYRVPLYEVGTTAAKTDFSKFLAVETPGPRFCHMPKERMVNHGQWFAQLLSEKRKQMPGGIKRWVVKYDKIRNEALDCRVYAYGALEGLKGTSIKGIVDSAFVVEETADRLDIPRAPSEAELGRMDLARVAEETRESVAQNRAKPLVSRRQQRPSEPDVAQVSDEQPEYAQPGRRLVPQRSLPAARRAPFTVRRPGTPRMG